MAHLIDKDAVVAEIEKRLKANGAFDEVGDEAWWEDKGMCDAYKSILSFLNTLEVKEVDLDFQTFAKEMDNVFALPSSQTKNTEENPLNWEYAIARHFFKLGLKAKQE